MRRIASGKRRTQIKVEQRGTSPTASGGTSDTWTTVIDRAWAAFEVAAPNEYFTASEHHAQVIHKVRINTRAGITPAMRISLIGTTRTMDIQTVRNVDERGFELELICQERTQ